MSPRLKIGASLDSFGDEALPDVKVVCLSATACRTVVLSKGAEAVIENPLLFSATADLSEAPGGFGLNMDLPWGSA